LKIYLSVISRGTRKHVTPAASRVDTHCTSISLVKITFKTHNLMECTLECYLIKGVLLLAMWCVDFGGFHVCSLL